MAARERVTKDPDSIAELETGLRIDQNALDEALQFQPDMFYRVSKQLTLLISRRDYAKQELSEIQAEVSQEIRESAEIDTKDKKPKTKIGVAEVDALVTLDKDVKKAHQALLELTREVGELTALKEAYTQRSYALKDLVALHIANYYSDSSQSNQRPAARERQYAEDREAISKARSSRT